MDRAATLPCPMMVVGVVMDAAPPNQSEATSAAFMEAPASKGGVRLFPWQARTAHRRQPHDEGEAAADCEDAGVCWRQGEAKPDRACSPEIVSPAMFHKKRGTLRVWEHRVPPLLDYRDATRAGWGAGGSGPVFTFINKQIKHPRHQSSRRSSASLAMLACNDFWNEQGAASIALLLWLFHCGHQRNERGR
jgi:hypothetical protein